MPVIYAPFEALIYNFPSTISLEIPAPARADMKSPTVLFLFIVMVVSVPSLFLTVTVLLSSPIDKSPNVVLLVMV